MKTSIMENKRASIISIIILIFIWKSAAIVYNNEALLPAPEAVIIRLFNIFSTADFIQILMLTLMRGMIGFLLSLTTGILLGTIAGINNYIEKLLNPVLTIFKSTPIMSIMLLLLIWFGTEKTPIFAGFMVAFPIIYTNMMEGTKNVDKRLVEMAKTYGIDTFHIIKNIYLPSTAPFIFAGISSAFSIGWRVTIGAEVLSRPPHAIGSEMWEAKLYIQIENLLAWTIVAILLSFIVEILIKKIERKIIGWKYDTKSKNYQSK